MKKFFKTLLIIIVIALVIIQFIRPAKSTSSHAETMAIASVVEVPEPVLQTLKGACYDCHSDEVTYPWYWNVQPVAWILADHIEDGQRHLNFSAFGSYTLRRQYKKLDEIREEMEHGEMPINSYKWLHKSGRLTEAQKQEIYSWVEKSRQLMEAKYPIDSLRRK